jgi:putative phage-type endonuclease
MSIQEKVKSLIETYGHDDQRTAAWHAKRGEMLTASEIWKALPDASVAQKHEIIMSKLVPRPRTEGPGPRALVWGTRLESVAKAIYCDYNGGTQIVDTTCVPHPTVPFLGASPDGITLTADPEDYRYGRLVEFKCPISRDFDLTTPIKPEYYHQMQLQMECTQLHECDFVEFKFKEANYSAWVDSKVQYKGFYAVYEDGVQVKYRDLYDTRDVPLWRKEELEEPEKWDIVYWVLEKWQTKPVSHDPSWLSTNIQSLTEVWNTVLQHRIAGTLPEHPKEKTTLTFTL